MKLGQVVNVLTVASFVIAYAVLHFDAKNDEQHLERQTQEITKLRGENDLLKKNHVIPALGAFERQGVPESLANRYYLIYVQLTLLTEAAGIPDGKQQWLMDRMREGLLHHLLTEYIILGLDDDSDPPKIAACLSISINWEKCKLYSELKTRSDQKIRDVSSQPIMILGNAFARLAKKEDLKITTQYKTPSKPTREALMTLGAIEKISDDNSIEVTYEEFDKLVKEALHLSDADKLEWRSGNEKETLRANSGITPELLVELKYVEKVVYKPSDSKFQVIELQN